MSRYNNLESDVFNIINDAFEMSEQADVNRGKAQPKWGGYLWLEDSFNMFCRKNDVSDIDKAIIWNRLEKTVKKREKNDSAAPENYESIACCVLYEVKDFKGLQNNDIIESITRYLRKQNYSLYHLEDIFEYIEEELMDVLKQWKRRMDDEWE